MAASFTFGAAMTLRVGGHIRVVLLLKNVPAPVRRALEILSAFAGFVLHGVPRPRRWSSSPGASLRRAGRLSMSSDTPLWFPQAVVTFGMLLLTLQFLARAIQAALGLPLEDHQHEGFARRMTTRAMRAVAALRRRKASSMTIEVVSLFVHAVRASWRAACGSAGRLRSPDLAAGDCSATIPLDKLLAQYAWNILTTQELLALPLFILMGEILFRTRLSRSLFQGPGAVGRRCCRAACCMST